MSHRTRIAALAATALAAVALAACGSSDDSVADVPPATPAAATTGAQTAAATSRIRLARVRGGLGDALFVAGAPGQPNRLYIVQQSGRILIQQGGRLLKRPFLDISSRISAGGERGLLGLAFHPDYAGNGRFYVDYTNPAGDTRVVEYHRADADRADPASARTLLAIRQPYPNHNGGDIVFGPDRDLYVAMGDGGSGGDPAGNGQNTRSLLGKLLRIDVDGRTGGRPYGIPADNPFASGSGGRPEIYAYGLRNPWRFSFDRTRGDLWIGDVGQGDVEEVDYRATGTGAGVNFGWNALEGRRVFKAGAARGATPTPPVAQYTHAVGCSVTGGYVYRGTRAPGLLGRYVYADFCTGKVWSMRAGPTPGPVREETRGLGVTLSNVTSFGEGPAGELYVLANGTLYRFVGR